MKSNRIPRAAKTLKVKFLIDTSGTKQGETVTVHKNDHGWVSVHAPQPRSMRDRRYCLRR